MGMGKYFGGEEPSNRPSYPTCSPGRCPYLNCRRDTGLSHSPPNSYPSQHPATQQPSRWMSEKRVGRSQEGKVRRQESASFCKWHGGLSSVCGPWARLRTSLSSLPPRAKSAQSRPERYLLSPEVVGRLPC